MRNYKKFDKSQRSSFPYWFWHWLAFNDVARELGIWKFHHLFHDIEKPFLRLFLPYKKVQAIHRRNHAHHLEYKHPEKRNWVDMIIDWQCASRTKYAKPRNAYEEAVYKLHEDHSMSYIDYCTFIMEYRKLCYRCPELFRQNHITIREEMEKLSE